MSSTSDHGPGYQMTNEASSPLTHPVGPHGKAHIYHRHPAIFNFLVFICAVTSLVGCILNISAPLHFLRSSGNSPTDYYYFDRVSSGGQDYYYADGVEYISTACLSSGIVTALGSCFGILCFSLLFIIALQRNVGCPLCCCPIRGSSLTELKLAFVGCIAFSISVVTWGSSCLFLTEQHTQTSAIGVSFEAPLFVVICILDLFAMLNVGITWHIQMAK